MNAQQEQNLRNVARALRESPNPDKFTMKRYGHGCGTPACALGHYAARPDLSGGRLALVYGAGGTILVDRNGYLAAYCEGTVQSEFGLSRREACALFDGQTGCGGAKTATEAIDFIEAFIASKMARGH